MKLKKMSLDNFKGVKHFDFFPFGKNASIYGDNGKGKSTLFDAFCWLMYGKPSTGEKNFSPQTVGTHHLDHMAEMTVELGDGKEITLKKVYHEVYKTQRGSADAVFSGYTTDHYVDGVPVKEGEYKKALAEIYKTEETAKLLTRPFYFLEDMNVKDRRKLLLDVCGDIGDSDIILRYPELKELPDILDGKGIESYLKIAGARKREIDKELKAIPQRIDEAEKAKPEITDDKESLESLLLGLEQEKASLESRLSSIDATAEMELHKQIAALELEKALAAKEYAIKHENDGKANRLKITELEEQIAVFKGKIRVKGEAVKEKEEAVERHRKQREKLISDYAVAAECEWNGDTVCPTCGQNLPAEKIEESKKAFNLHKSENLERISREGQKVSITVIANEENEIEAIKSEIEAVTAEMNEAKEKLEDARAVGARESTPDFNITAAAADFDAKMKVLKDRLAELRSGTEGEKERIRGLIAEVVVKADRTKRQLLDLGFIDKQDERIRELEASERQNAAEYEKLEHGIHLCEMFYRRKAEMLTDKINSRFKTLRFRLFIEQINGGIVEDCEAMLDCDGVEVPFKSANNSSRINAGLEVIDTLGDYYGFGLPIWIDNCEGISRPISTTAQQIRLYVSEEDKELRVKEQC